jgi:guanylate kinase
MNVNADSDAEPAAGLSGRLVIFSGPSGVGKTTVLAAIFASCKRPLVMSVSATTRPQRAGETAGVSYHYLSDQEFQQRRQRDEFLECTEVFGRGHWYGTLKDTVKAGLAEGKWVILEIDVDGAQKVLKHYPDAITIFVHPGSAEELERRLRGRGTESESALLRRLEVAGRELAMANQYEHIVINQSVDQTAADICNILESAE